MAVSACRYCCLTKLFKPRMIADDGQDVVFHDQRRAPRLLRVYARSGRGQIEPEVVA